jgi:hypothetical protein
MGKTIFYGFFFACVEFHEQVIIKCSIFLEL